MKDFEAAFSLLDGFQFKSETDRANALQVMHWVHQTTLRPGAGPFPLVVITGPDGCGKTTLIERMKPMRGIARFNRVEPVNLENAVSSQAALVVFEEQTAKGLADAVQQRLVEFVKARKWTWVPSGEDKERTAGKCCVVVVTGGPSLRLPEELEEIAIRIRMKAREVTTTEDTEDTE